MGKLLLSRYGTLLLGTILSCPSDACGLGLYRIVAPATCEDLVVFDDTVLAPLNDSIPPHDVWQILACPFCGARLLKMGRFTRCSRDGSSASACPIHQVVWTYRRSGQRGRSLF
jgi:hypothetical protein